MVWSLGGLMYTPHDPMDQSFQAVMLGAERASSIHLLGFDGLGRDFFSRLWRGSGNTVGMACLSVALTCVMAVLLLLVANRMGRWAERVVPALISIWVTVPVVLIGLLLLLFLRPSPFSLVLAAALGTVPLAYRQMQVLWRDQANALYVESSIVIGTTGWDLFRKTIWPNLQPDILALLRMVFALAVLELSGLAFLGLIGDPDFPELGLILRQNLPYLGIQTDLLIWPGVLLSGILLSVHLAGE